jgi:hypothetical protein
MILAWVPQNEVRRTHAQLYLRWEQRTPHRRMGGAVAACALSRELLNRMQAGGTVLRLDGEEPLPAADRGGRARDHSKIPRFRDPGERDWTVNHGDAIRSGLAKD